MANEHLDFQCGGNFHLMGGMYSCNTKYPGTVTFSAGTDPSAPGYNQYFFGIDMHFWVKWPWAEDDADHRCFSKAVEAASCAGANVKSWNGRWCSNVYWKPDPQPLEWSDDMGPP